MMAELEGVARPPAAPGEDDLQRRLAEAIAVLGQGGDRAEFLAAWGRVLDALPPGQPPTSFVLQRALFSVSFAIGAQATTPAEVRPLVRECFRAARARVALPAREARRMLANAYLAAISTRLRVEGVRQAVRFLRRAAREAPGAVARLRKLPGLLRALEKELDDARIVSRWLDAAWGDLARLRRSWTWRVGRLLTGAARLLGRALRQPPARRQNTA
jgi:hypothetical protein